MEARLTTKHDVIIVGAGVAGIVAATSLAAAGRHVLLVESRPQLGGRASSFIDHDTGETIDNCQHVVMGCCTQFLEFCEQIGIADQFRREASLTFLAPECVPYRFAASWLPAPLHLSLAFLRLPYLSLYEKWQFARGVGALWRSPAEVLRGRSFLDWLRAAGQPDRVIRRVWEVLLISALSESLGRIDASYARHVLVDGFLTNRTGWEVCIPRVPLDELFSGHALPWLRSRGVEVCLNSAVAALEASADRIEAVRLKSGGTLAANNYIVAVPWHRVRSLFDASTFQQLALPPLENIESAPITSVHLWTDRPLLALRHLVLVDRLCQWLFEHPQQAASTAGYRYQVVISASRMLHQWDRSTTIQNVWAELKQIFPEAESIVLKHARVVTEHRAVFSPLPGIDLLRPPQQTAIGNLQLAGDWTQTGWPATLEGATRSGRFAAENILRRD